MHIGSGEVVACVDILLNESSIKCSVLEDIHSKGNKGSLITPAGGIAQTRKGERGWGGCGCEHWASL